MSTEKKALEKLVDRLAEARRGKKLTQVELARMLRKRHQSSIAKIEQYQKQLDLPDFVRWARAVDLDPSELLREFEQNLGKRARLPWPEA